MEFYAILWLALLIAFLVVEASTVTLISLWFAAGSLAALVATLLYAPLWLQVLLFFAVSAGLLACLRPIVRKRLPMLGNVACGEPIFAGESHESYVDANSDTDADFCLTAKGDSMVNARIFDGDVLFVKSQPTVEDGEIAVVLIEDEATVKRVYYDKENNVITLAPENPLYKPMRYEGAKLDQIRILGKVVSGQYRI